MRFQKFILLLPFIFFISQLNFAQIDKSDYQLLWEISGNGLEKPSYLFGTIHLKDKRAFEFSDSLLYKLEESEAFATEVHPDSAFLFYSKAAFSKDTTDYLKKMMSPEAYERLKKQLKNREGISLDSIESKNPYYIESLFDRSPKSQSDDKDLFVDLYLYRMARRSGKLTFGLEKVEDHRSMVNLFFKRFEYDDYPKEFDQKDFDWKTFQTNRVERLLNIYRSGSLEKIQSFLEIHSDSAYNEAALTERNVIMADNIKKIIHNNTLFAAMGTAHLPGEGGVINLLKNSGYTLRPVTANFTGKVDEFKLKEKEPIWQKYKEDYHRFEVDLPGEPYIWQYKKKGLQLLSHYMIYNDIAEDNGYVVKVSTEFKEEDEHLDSFLLNIVQLTFLPNKGINQIQHQVIQQNGIGGLEFQVKADSTKYLKGRIFYNGTAVYQALVRREDNHLDHNDIDRFLNSLKIAKPKIYGWKRFNSEQGAFSIATPFEPDENSIDFSVPNQEGDLIDIKLNFFSVRDAENGMMYLMRYNGIGAGHYIDNDSFFYNMAIEDFKLQSKLGEPDTVFTIYNHGYEGREVIFKNDISSMRIQLFLRGARMYLVLAANLNGKDEKSVTNDFFNSFKFQDLNHSKLSKQILTDHGFSIDLPKQPRITLDTLSSYHYPNKTNAFFYAEDEKTNLNYFINKIRLSKYYQIDTLEKYLEELVDSDLSTNDTILINRKITISGYQGRYFKQASKLTHNDLYGYIILIGNDLYEIYFYAPEEIDEGRVLSFLNSFDLIGEPSNVNLEEKKIEMIMKDFKSSDSLTQENALVALKNHPLVENELPYIYEALDQPYPNDSIEYNSTVGMLCNFFRNTTDSNTVDFLISNYNKFPNEPIRKSTILKTLASINTNESITGYLDLFKDYAPQDSSYYSYGLLNPFSDSLEFLLQHYDLVINKNQTDTTWGNQLDDLVLQLVDNDSIDISFINKDADLFINSIKAIVKEENYLEKDSITYTINYSRFLSNVNILRKLDLNKAQIKYLKELLAIKDQYLCGVVARGLICQNQKIPKKVWKKIAASPNDQFSVIRIFKLDSLQNKLPKAWLKKDFLAKLKFYSFSNEDYHSVKMEDIQPFRDFQFEYKDDLFTIYTFKFKDSENQNHVGMVSLPSAKDHIDLSYLFFNYSYEPVEEGKENEKIDSFLEWYKTENEKWEKEKMEPKN